MILSEVALTACLMLSSVPDAQKVCEKEIKKQCFGAKKMRSYKTCFEKIAPVVNAVAKEEYGNMGKACTLN